jgi:hypothetical protein
MCRPQIFKVFLSEFKTSFRILGFSSVKINSIHAVQRVPKRKLPYTLNLVQKNVVSYIPTRKKKWCLMNKCRFFLIQKRHLKTELIIGPIGIEYWVYTGGFI